MKLVQTLEEEIWTRFVYEHPQGNIFHTPEMFDVFSKAKGFEPTLWAVLDESHDLLALFLPVQITVLGGILHFLTTRAVVFGSVLWQPGDKGERALQILLRSYTQQTSEAPLFTELRNLSELTEIQPLLKESGFVFEDHLNYLIDLDCSTETLFQNIGRRTRKNIRRGLNRDRVAIREVERQEKISESYNLLKQTFERAKVPLEDISLFEAAVEILYPKGMIRFVNAYVEQRAVATSIELLYKDIVYGWKGGVNREYSQFAPGELLMWNVLKWGAENNFRLYDFGGAGKPDEDYGVRDFKAKFGGQLVSYGRNTYVHKPKLFWLSQQGYKILRRWL